jgi:hypothetical protein
MPEKRRNYRPRPKPPPELKTIGHLIIGPDGKEHEFDDGDWTTAIRMFYPCLRNHRDKADWYCIKEDGSRIRVDGMIYDVLTDRWMLEPRGHEIGPGSCSYVRSLIENKLKCFKDKLPRIGEDERGR